MTIIGVDPGKSGGIALMIDGILVDVMDMPVETHITGSKMVISASNEVSRVETTKRVVSDEGIFAVMSDFLLRSRGPVEVAIENVHEMPNQSGMFAFGQSAGYVKMAATALGLPKRLVEPSVWKRVMGCTDDKHLSVDWARKLFPHCAKTQFKYYNSEGRAEAALIALYQHRKASKP